MNEFLHFKEWRRPCGVVVWFYGIPTIVGYLMPNIFYTYKQSYFKQFSLA